MKKMKIAIRLTNWIGDVVMNLPALEVVRRNYPDAEITAIARPRVCEVLHFRKDLVDRILPFDDRSKLSDPFRIVRFGLSLRQEAFDMAITLSYHFKGPAMMYFTGAPVRIGFSSWDTGLFLTHALARKALPKAHRHQSENFIDLLERAAGMTVPRREAPRLIVSQEQQTEVAAKFLANRDTPLLVVHPGAAFGTAKRWLPERYVGLVRQFLAEKGGTVVLLGVPEEAALNQEIFGAVADPRLINLCSQTSLSESIGLIAQASAFISGDSGLMHIAAAIGVPQVAVFGPTDPSASFPYSPKAKVVHHPVPCGPCKNRHCPLDHACMKGVTTEEVYTTLNQQLTQPR